MDASWEKYLPQPYVAFDTCDQECKTDWDPEFNASNPYISGENFKNEKSHYAIGLHPQSERLVYSLELTRLLLQEIQNLCDTNDCEFIIFQKLDPIQREAIETKQFDCQKIGDKYYIYSEYLIDQRQKELNSDFISFDIPVLTDQWVVSDLDSHLNPESNRQVITSLADSLIYLMETE
jgi:hypothetical protein